MQYYTIIYASGRVRVLKVREKANVIAVAMLFGEAEKDFPIRYYSGITRKEN